MRKWNLMIDHRRLPKQAEIRVAQLP